MLQVVRGRDQPGCFPTVYLLYILRRENILHSTIAMEKEEKVEREPSRAREERSNAN